METGDPVKFVKISKEEFEKLDHKDPGTIYFVTTETDKNNFKNIQKFY